MEPYAVRLRIIRSLAVGCGLILATMAAQAEDSGKPVGVIHLSEASVAVGIGYTWGDGVLEYKGKRYPFKLTGLTAGELGGTKVTARGDVYHLSSLEDFNGNYTSVGAGATAAGGFDVEAMRNGKGVEIKLVSTTQGADLKAAIEGLKITLKD
jgi:hypothetical protein